MRKTAIFFLIAILQGVILPFLPTPQSYASDLTNTSIGLDRQKVSTATGGQICSTTPSSDNGVEASLQVIFPQGFTVNQTASNWTVTTSNIPLGATAWPGISTASIVSGQIVTFPSSNLSSSTQYCFNFTSTNTLTTPSSTGSYPGTVRTRTSGNTTIDSIDYGLGIVSNDQINVTATVPAKPTDFQAILSKVSPNHGTYAQNTILMYKLTYGSFLDNPINITLEADWSLGTIEGLSTPTENILEYVVGSATDAYGATPPVIDLVNRRIYWSISAFPANTSNQEVYFQIRTNNSYTEYIPVTFSARGRIVGPGTQTSYSKVDLTYLNLTNQPGTSPTCTPSQCPTPTPIPASAPTSTSQPQSPQIQSVDIRSISDTSAQIDIATDIPTSLQINYGVNPQSLGQRVSVLQENTRHLITLPDLEPNSRYYFRIVATGAAGGVLNSDLFIVNTASDKLLAKANEESLFLTSGDVILLDPTIERVGTPKIVIPKNTRFSFKFIVDNYDTVESVVGVVENNSVLGIMSNKAYANTNSLTVTELYPGQYIGTLTTSNAPGNFSLFLRITDFNGNISEQEISNLLIVDYLRIVSSKTKNPVEKARTTIYFYNSRTKIYELLSKAVTPFENPTNTNPEGYIPIVLPEGKYKAEILALGYENKTVEFEIGPSSPKYPVIELEPAPFSLATYFEYTISNALDALTLLDDYLNSLKSSPRFLELVTLIVVALFILLALMQFSRVFGVPVLLLPVFALYHLFALFHKPKHPHFIQGKVVDISTNIPLEGVLLHFSSTRGQVFAHARTNIDGDFTARVRDIALVKMTISKKGYDTLTRIISKDDIHEKLTVTLSVSQKPERFGIGTITWYFKSIAESFFETFLILTIVIELVFAQQFGIAKILLPLIVSVGNLLLWALHARPRKASARRA